MRINFIISTWGDSHQLNRFIRLKSMGMKPYVMSYLRDYYPSKISEPDLVLGKLKNASYYQRIFQYFKGFFKLGKALITNKAPVYLFGFDNLILVRLIHLVIGKRNRVIYEIPDIRDFQTHKGLISKMLMAIYKWALSAVDIFVLTSPEFETGYFNSYLGYRLKKTIVIENKIHEDLIPQSKKVSSLSRLNKPPGYQLVIGYFGLLRCKRSLEILRELAIANSGVLVVLRGIFVEIPQEIEMDLKSLTNVTYLGTYKSPEDLATMYDEIDISWVAYPFSDKEVGNWKWARTNRYYEAGYFKTPMIAAEGTMDGENVKKGSFGLAVDLSKPNQVLAKLKSIRNDDLKLWRESIKNKPKGTFAEDGDYEKLYEEISN